MLAAGAAWPRAPLRLGRERRDGRRAETLPEVQIMQYDLARLFDERGADVLPVADVVIARRRTARAVACQYRTRCRRAARVAADVLAAAPGARARRGRLQRPPEQPARRRLSDGDECDAAVATPAHAGVDRQGHREEATAATAAAGASREAVVFVAGRSIDDWCARRAAARLTDRSRPRSRPSPYPSVANRLLALIDGPRDVILLHAPGLALASRACEWSRRARCRRAARGAPSTTAAPGQGRLPPLCGGVAVHLPLAD